MKYQLKELSIELTNECRLACIHCSSGSSPKALTGELDHSDHIRLITEARELGASILSLSGGDPLMYGSTCLYSDSVALLSLINGAVLREYERILLYTTGHNRNGNMIYDYPWIRDLLHYKNLAFIFSLHSPFYEVNDHIMGKGASINIHESIRWLVKQGAKVEMHMVPMGSSFKDIGLMRALCKDLGISKLSLLRFVPQTRGKDNFDELGMTKAEFSQMQFFIHQEMVWKHDHPVEIRAGCPIDFRHAVGLLPEKAKPCHAGDDLMLVRPDGSVHPCAAWKSLPADSNVKDYSLKHIWEHSPVFNEIRAFKQVSEDPIMSYPAPAGTSMCNTCNICSMLDSCLTGCLAQRIHAAPELGMDALRLSHYSDPLCPRGNGDVNQEPELLVFEVNNGPTLDFEVIHNSCDCGCGCVGQSCEVTHAGV